MPDPGVKKAPDPGSGSATVFLQGKPLDRTVDVDASVWEDADITPTTTLEGEEEEEYKDETDAELTQTLEEVSYTLPSLSRILILSIRDLGSRIQKQQKKRVVKKKFVVLPFFVATNITKLKNKIGPVY
jgi:hypothetical protein